jgi:glucose 1-dehydrogenase
VVREFGRLDIRVNNAGVARNRDILEITEAEFDSIPAAGVGELALATFAAAYWMPRLRGG